MKFYGNVTNRFEEGHNFTEDKMIHEGDDITMYYWSDRTCYYVTKVIDQKHIFVKRYYVCADHDAPSMSNTWKYFKSHKEMNEYLRKYFPDTTYEDNDINAEEEWSFKYNNWKRVWRKDYNDVITCINETKEFDKETNRTRTEDEYLDHALKRLTSTKTNYEKLKNKKPILEYSELSGKVSFGVCDYYYDYEF